MRHSGHFPVCISYCVVVAAVINTVTESNLSREKVLLSLLSQIAAMVGVE